MQLFPPASQAAPHTPAPAAQAPSNRAAPSGVRQSIIDDRDILTRAGAAAQARRRAHTEPLPAAAPAQIHSRSPTWPRATLPVDDATVPPRMLGPWAFGPSLPLQTASMAPFPRRQAVLTPFAAATPRSTLTLPGPAAPAPRLLRRVPPPPLEPVAMRIDATAATTLEGLIDNLLRTPMTPPTGRTLEPAVVLDDEAPQVGPSRDRDLPSAGPRRPPEDLQRQLQRRLTPWLAGDRQDFGAPQLQMVPPTPTPSLAYTLSDDESNGGGHLISRFSDTTQSGRSSMASSFRFARQLPWSFDDADARRRSSIAGHSFLRSLTPTSPRSTADERDSSAASDGG